MTHSFSSNQSQWERIIHTSDMSQQNQNQYRAEALQYGLKPSLELCWEPSAHSQGQKFTQSNHGQRCHDDIGLLNNFWTVLWERINSYLPRRLNHVLIIMNNYSR